MASEKVMEVEMEEITPTEEREDKEAGKGEKEPEEKEKDNEEDEEDDLYSKLNSPTENIYCLATKPTSPAKPDDIYRKVILYRRLSAILLLVCLLLLAVLLALAVKLSEAKSSQECPTGAMDMERTTVGVCSRTVCEAMYPRELVRAQTGHACTGCGRGWLKFEDSCYFLSQTRLNWLQSREQCKKLGGDLVVISNEHVQRFLTQNGLLMYWIGLSRSDSQQWTWINNTVLTNSYWSDNLQSGDCVFLNGGTRPRKNWYQNPCAATSQYICQKS